MPIHIKPAHLTIPASDESAPATNVPYRKDRNNPLHADAAAPTLLWSFRGAVGVFLMLILFATTSMRMNLAMALVCMVNSTAFVPTGGGSASSAAPMSPASTLLESVTMNGSASSAGGGEDRCRRRMDDEFEAMEGYKGTLLWNSTMQSQLFSAVFYGSLLTTWISGYLADRLGPRILLTVTLVDYVLVSLASPVLAVWGGYIPFVIARFIMGLGEGFVYPSLSATAARWFPPMERSRMVAFYTIGTQLASVVGLSASSRLCSVSFFGGWPLIFYVFGSVGLVVLALWTTFVTDKPGENSWIGAAERSYIDWTTTAQWTPAPSPAPSTKTESISADESTRRRSSATLSQRSSKRLIDEPIPWRSMTASPPLYAIFCAQTAFNLTIIVMQSYLPTYLKEVLRLDLSENGLFSMIPFSVQIFSKLLYGSLSDRIKQRGIFTSTGTAKLFQSVGNFGCCLVFLTLAFGVRCERLALAAAMLVCYGLFFSACICGFFTSILCVAPAHAGLVTSMTTLFGTAASAVGPVVVAFMQRNVADDRLGWAMVWSIVAAANLVAGVVFLLFGSAEIQPWARPKSSAPNTPCQWSTSDDDRDAGRKRSESVVRLEVPCFKFDEP